MDRVRLGRVLGRSARMAARTVYDAVDAASSPAPTTRETHPAPAAHPQPVKAAGRSEPQRVVQQAVRTAGRVQGSARAARQSMLAPVKRASRTVTLEITGSFFALFAFSFGAAAWRFHSAAGSSGVGTRLWIYLGFAALFGYFAVSSFLRARRISRSQAA